MIKQLPIPRFLGALSLIAGSILHVPATNAVIISVGGKNPPEIKLTVGKGGGNIRVVTFDVPAGQVGNSTPITGDKEVDMIVQIRATPAFSRVARLTVDSSSPLTNGSITLLMSDISWVATQGDIPSGTFNNTTNQFMMSYPNSFKISDK